MPTLSRPRLFQPQSRAEAAAPLTAVEEACRSDPGYLASVARIIANVLDAANAVTEPAPDPEAPQPSARARRAWSGVMERINAR